MKILKAEAKNDEITRGVLSKMGEAMYHSQNVESVEIEVKFSDGTSLRFKRDEDEDHYDALMEKK